MQSHKLTILGSTGSIGTQTLDVISQHPEKFSVFALTANKNIDLLFEQCKKFEPQYAVIVSSDLASLLEERFRAAKIATTVLAGHEALVDVATDEAADTVMAGIVGAAGLIPTFAAVEAGKRVLIANKEPLVMAGQLFIDAAKKSGAMLLPVDSEHNAIFQCMPNDFHEWERPPGVEKIILTASGGPFRNTTLEQLAEVTPEQAVAHPNWSMGAKISVDSATMMNKGLEVIEAHWLFNMPLSDIDVLIHPQSIIHSLVQYSDGSTLAQLGNPDMRTPIANALAWPHRISAGVDFLDLLRSSPLEFHSVELNKYPCLGLAYQSMETGGVAPIVLNAANEIFVDAFLNKNINYQDIARGIEDALSYSWDFFTNSIEEIVFLDDQVRNYCTKLELLL